MMNISAVAFLLAEIICILQKMQNDLCEMINDVWFMDKITATVKKITTHTLRQMKAAGEKISMLTAYDYTMARLLDEAGVDVLLVGDSAANVMAGYETTLPITLDQMIYHAASVVRG